MFPIMVAIIILSEFGLVYVHSGYLIFNSSVICLIWTILEMIHIVARLVAMNINTFQYLKLSSVFTVFLLSIDFS